MNLKDALLCIDCDEVFAVEGSSCSPRCPACASSIFAPLSTWVQTWGALERSLGGTEQESAGRRGRKEAEAGDRPPNVHRCLILGSRRAADNRCEGGENERPKGAPYHSIRILSGIIGRTTPPDGRILTVALGSALATLSTAS